MSNISFWKYRWFDTPNNEDGPKKAFALGKTATRIGLTLGLVDAVVFDTSTSNLQKALRVGYWVVPMVGMSTAFAVTQQISLKVFPSLDEKFSFMFGGVAAAGVMGSWFKNGQMAFVSSLLFGGMGFAYQYMREARAEGKGTKWEEAHSLYLPEDFLYLSYERHQDSHWLTNNYDWRQQNKERGKRVDNMVA